MNAWICLKDGMELKRRNCIEGVLMMTINTFFKIGFGFFVVDNCF